MVIRLETPEKLVKERIIGSKLITESIIKDYKNGNIDDIYDIIINMSGCTFKQLPKDEVIKRVMDYIFNHYKK